MKRKSVRHLHRWNLISLALLTLVTAAHADLSSGLVAYYPFNGNANDTSGNGKNGLNIGAVPTTDRLGNANSALYFNGSAYVSLTNRPLTGVNNAFSVSEWFSAQNTGIGYLFRHRAHPEVNMLWSYHIPNRLRWEIVDVAGVSHELVLDAVPLNQWFHCVGTYDGSVQKLYVNGVLVTNSSWIGTIDWDQNQECNHPDAIGGDPCFIDGLFDGSLDDVRIYNRALSASEIQQLFQGRVGGPVLAPGDIVVSDADAFGGGGGIIKVDPTSGAQTSLASGGAFSDPSGIVVKPNGNLIVADVNGKIIEVNPASGNQTIISSGGSFVEPR